MSFVGKIRKAQAALAQRDADPFRHQVEGLISAIGETVSTAAMLDLLNLPRTTGNGRRLARTMRSLGFVPIKSRRLMPGGYKDTVTRGWARPVRQAGPPRNSHLCNNMKGLGQASQDRPTVQQKEACDAQLS